MKHIHLLVPLFVGLLVAVVVVPVAAQRPPEYRFDVSIYAQGTGFGTECDGEDDVVDEYETGGNPGQGQFRMEPSARRWTVADLTAETFVYYDTTPGNGEVGRELQWTNLVHYGPWSHRNAWSVSSELKQDRQPYFIVLDGQVWPRPGHPLKWEMYQVFRNGQSGPVLAQCEAEVLVTDEVA